MGKAKILAAALVGLPLLYMALPLWAAWDLRMAVKTADAKRLSPRVDWPTLRQNLKVRIAQRVAYDNRDAGWVRRQATRIVAPALTERAIDMVITPDRLGWLLKRRLQWRDLRSDRPAEPTTPLPDDDDDPLALEPSRLRWAFFESLTAFRFEVRDKVDPKRTLVARLQLDGFSWKLVDIAVVEPRA